MASLFSTTSGVAVIDTRVRPGTITLPLTTQIPNRYLQIKDLYGAFGRSSLTLSTQTGERFDDGTTSKVFTDPFTFFTLYAASTTRWAQLGGTQTIQQTVSSLLVSSLTIGTGSGWLQLPPIQTIYASTVITQAQALYSLSSYFGGTSTATTLEYWGLFGNYNNTILAEVSTGAGTQEFLVFKGSSASDRVRVQTTGTFVVETGVSARLWNDNTTATLSNATPSFIINASSNVGIQTASPGATLDVAGTARAVTFSSQQLFVSSINGGGLLATSNLTSTVTGLGSAGFLSTASLVSTTFGLQTAGFVSAPNLLNFVSTSFLNTTLQSTTGQLQSNIENWSQYKSQTDVTIGTGTGITVENPSNTLQLKANTVSIEDGLGGFGNLIVNAISFQTSTTQESYLLWNNELATGSVSSFAILRNDGGGLDTGSLFLSSMYFGNIGGTTSGQLTTDGTATNLFWNGSQLNNQGGGGGGGGAIPYVSAFTVSTGFLFASTISTFAVECYGVLGSAFLNPGPDNMAITSLTDATINANSTMINTNAFHVTSSNDARFVITSNAIFDATLATFSNIYCYNTVSTYSMAVYGPNTLVVDGTTIMKSNVSIDGVLTNRIKVVISTLGFEDMFVQVQDISTKFLLEGSNSPQNLVLPDLTTVGSNWNVTLNNQFTNYVGFTILDTSSNVIGPTLNPGQSLTATTDGTRWYFF